MYNNNVLLKYIFYFTVISLSKGGVSLKIKTLDFIAILIGAISAYLGYKNHIDAALILLVVYLIINSVSFGIQIGINIK